MAMTKEEHARKQRRRARQMLGLLIAALALIGVVSVVRAGVVAVGSLFDDTADRAEYQAKLEGFVRFDPLPFSGGIENCDDLTLRETAVWGTVYGILDTETGLANYELDPVTEEVLLPAVEVDAYLAKIVGPDFKLAHQSFDMEDMTVEFDEEKQCYHIPITGSVGMYDATVVKLFKSSGRLHVTVGYIPTYNSSDLTTGNPTEPTKYMDYIFERSNGNWYLTGLEESETKPENTPAPTLVPTPDVADSSLQEAIMAGAGASSSGADAGSSDAVDSADAGSDAAGSSGADASSDAEG